MRAIQFSDFGGPEVLQLEDVPVPEPAADQVRVAVHVAGVNPADWKIREGQMGNPKLPHRPGLELSGVVDATGVDSEFNVGDEVFGWAVGGAYAEYALARVIALKPTQLDWWHAASLPVAGEAALRGLRLLDVQRDDVLLIHGASGAVGTFATQLAVDRGATVIGTAGQARADYLRGLGATPVPYGAGLVDWISQITPRVDAVLDAAGFGVLDDSVALRGSTDRIVTLADSAASQKGITFSTGERGDRNVAVLNELADEAAYRQLQISHGQSYQLADAAQAQRQSATAHSGGKITLQVR